MCPRRGLFGQMHSLDRLVWIGVSKSGFAGVSRGCEFARSAWGIPLVSGPVVTQDPEGLMQRSLPALRATRRAAHDLQVAAAGCARRPAVTWPPVDDDRAWLPEMPEAAVLREAGKRRASWLVHDRIQTYERSAW